MARFALPGLGGRLSAAIVSGLLVTGLSAAISPPAFAATLVVNKTSDTVDAAPGNGACADSVGGCSLRAAVMEANALAGADTITVPAGTYALTRTFTGPADPNYENDNFCTADDDSVGDLDVKGSDLTINGAGSGSTIIDGGDIDRVFSQGSGPCGLGVDAPDNTVNLAITNTTIRNGYVNEVFDDDPTGNSGQNFADGGGIYFDGFNTATGGASANRTLTLTNVVLSGNEAEWNGGAVFARFASVNMTGSTVTNNIAQAGHGGGAIHIPRDDGVLTIANSTFSGNRALFNVESSGPSGGQGGGVYINARGTTSITNSSFANNEAELDGGGIYTANIALTASGLTVTGNKAGRHGGGLYDDPDTSVTLGASSSYTNLTVQSNSADVNITDAGVTTDDGVGNGGGIYKASGLLTLLSSTIGGSGVGNTAQNGGAIAFTDGTSDIRKNHFLANSATASGGGIYQTSGTLTSHLNRFRGNTAATGRGIAKSGGTLTAAANSRNWWGCNTDPTAGAAACDNVTGVAAAGVDPRLVLTHTASPGIVYVTPPPAGQPNSTTLTATVLKDSGGAAVPVADVTVLLGLPLTFNNAVFGTLSGAGTSVGAGGTATATFTSGATGGPGSADATVDSAVATAAIEVYEPPQITVPADITVQEDTVHSHNASVSWTTTATGYPAPTITCKIGSTTITSPHTFPEGPTTVDCTASSAAGSDTESFTVTVLTSPTLTVPADITVAESSPGSGSASVTFTASAQGYPSPVAIDCEVGGTSIGSGNDSVTITHTFSGGVTIVSCTADNGVNPPETKTFTVSVETKPEITVPAPITVVEDTPGGGTASVAWTTSTTGYPAPTVECKIGTTTITSPHTFPEGTTTVECTATNSQGSDTESFTVTVQTTPHITVPADITVTEDTPGGGTASVSFTVTATGEPAPTIECKIGTTTITSPHTFPEGVTTVECTATNSVGSDSDTFTVTVQTRPHITVPADITVVEDTPGGGTASVSWVTTATGHPAPTTTCEAGGTTITSPHDFPLGTTTVTCTATNSIGSDSKSFDVTVVAQNQAPVISHTGPYTVGEGDTVGLDASGTSDPDGDPVTIEWDLDNNGSYETSGATPTFDASALDGPASLSVGIRASDSNGGVSTATTTVTVTNMAPSLQITGPSSVGAGSSLSLTFTATDPSGADQADSFTYDIDWGDGATQAVIGVSPRSIAHTYATPGEYTVTATATDKDGDISAPATYQVAVAGVTTITDPCGSGNLLETTATAGDDTLRVDPASGGMVRVTLNGSVLGTFSPGAGLVIHGLGGNDTINVNKTVNTRVVVFGGIGNDTIEAGQGSAVVFAGDGDDQVMTRNDRDILIGGLGADLLNGGSGEDILIAGTTSYDDAGLATLCGIIAEWTRTDAAYATRIGHLDGSIGGGLNGTSHLKGPGAGQTIFDDAAADNLRARNNLDWFFYNHVAPGVLDTADRTSSEQRVDL